MGTRESLVDAATALLDEGGVAAVTLREVGRQVGVSHNAPYKHFASKELLLAAVRRRSWRAGPSRSPRPSGANAHRRRCCGRSCTTTSPGRSSARPGSGWCSARGTSSPTS
ncbi:TetR/AcrR family transcriptional regulator [Actinophytocola sp.]|uniref:TetR/AcrR family transcriptional regulator n=1 Tax=Actinophytocola sp. TaxID=1872138 RepID=UPI0025C08BEE|nr:TetR/AcrR family transcriptional regulator [Actinophytocola sp.]